MKYKDENDFAEKVINKLSFVRSMNIKVAVSEYSIGYKPRKGKSFYGGREITATFMTELTGIIDGLRFAFKELKGNENEKQTK